MKISELRNALEDDFKTFVSTDIRKFGKNKKQLNVLCRHCSWKDEKWFDTIKIADMANGDLRSYAQHVAWHDTNPNRNYEEYQSECLRKASDDVTRMINRAFAKMMR